MTILKLKCDISYVYECCSSERVSTSTVLLIKGLLTLDPNERFTATRVLQHINLIVTELKSPSSSECMQIVPDIDDKLKANDNEKNVKDETESLGTTRFSGKLFKYSYA